jgi:hypothetical protein
MQRFLKSMLIVALAVVGGAWSNVSHAQATHDAVAKARGSLNSSAAVQRTTGRSVAARAATPRPYAVAQLPSASTARRFSYAPSNAAEQAPQLPVVVRSAPAQPQRLGFHDAGAKVRGDFGK